MYLRCVVRQKISDIKYFFQVVLARIVVFVICKPSRVVNNHELDFLGMHT